MVDDPPPAHHPPALSQVEVIGDQSDQESLRPEKTPDVTQHGEEAYTRGDGAVLVMPSITATSPRSTDESVPVALEVPA